MGVDNFSALSVLPSEPAHSASRFLVVSCHLAWLVVVVIGSVARRIAASACSANLTSLHPFDFLNVASCATRPFVSP